MSSTTTTTLHNFVVYAPDKTEAGTFEKRMGARPKHLENAKTLIQSGFVSKSMEHLVYLYVVLQIQVNS
jgi:hypothetical protein